MDAIKPKLEEILADMEQTVKHWEQEDTTDFEKGYTAGYAAAIYWIRSYL